LDYRFLDVMYENTVSWKCMLKRRNSHRKPLT
jgi:hypothetical protein